MKRKVYDKLLEWKNEWQGKEAILIEGARRVGKSYIVKEFAENEYDSYILIDFNKAPKVVCSWFDDYLDDLDRLFLLLQNQYHVKLKPRKSLIIFDEVQFCPRARSAIKYLVEDGRYDYIETGSLISIKKNVKDIMIPSEERRIQMYPMDFEEFMWALGNDMLMDLIRTSFDGKKPMGKLMHKQAMDIFRLYMIVGGMPQAVSEYVASKDFERVDAVKRKILSIYRDDIRKYADDEELRVTSIFDEIPSQLQRHEQRFKLTSINASARFRDYQDSFIWLDEAFIINSCFSTTEPNIGLGLNRDRMTLKCYMGDTGLLISHAFSERDITSNELYIKLLTDKLEVNAGMLVENIVAQMLRCSGHKLYFYSKSDNNDASNRMEIDFLIQKSNVTSRHNISPLEVKSSTHYSLSSIRKFMAKYPNYLSTPYVIHPADLEEKDGFLYIPLYMTPLL